MQQQTTKAILTVRDLSKLYGITRHCVPAYVEAGLLPAPVIIATGKTARPCWKAAEVQRTLGIRDN